jgi:hypothetical protein
MDVCCLTRRTGRDDHDMDVCCLPRGDKQKELVVKDEMEITIYTSYAKRCISNNQETTLLGGGLFLEEVVISSSN